MGTDNSGTEAQAIEKDRIRYIDSDEDVLLAINRFDHWVKKQNLDCTDAVSQMLHFLRDSIQNNIPLRDALNHRLKSLFEGMVDKAAQIDSKAAYAMDYDTNQYFGDIFHACTRPKFLYMAYFISAVGDIYGNSRSTDAVLGKYNATISRSVWAKFNFSRNLSLIKEVDDERRKAAFELFDVAALAQYYNIPYHSNNMGGRAVWEEGEEIALGIYDFILNLESRGLLCSLLPPTGPLEVDWSDHQWVFEPINQQWLHYKHPRDLINYFDQMAATS